MKKINLSGIIGWDVTPQDFRRQLEEAGGEDLTVEVSSPGGGVGACLEMYNDLKRYKGETTAVYTGYAMSAASYIPLAADKRVAESNAVFMIHNAQGFVAGDHNAMFKQGATMQAVSAMVAGYYADVAGKGVDEIQELMDGTTYYVGGEAIVAAGFADDVVKNDDLTQSDEATAMLMYNDAIIRMQSDQENAEQDMKRTLTMLGDVPKGNKAHQRKKEVKMDLNMLKEKHPDLVALVVDEAQSGMREKIDAARLEGAEVERERIKSVKEQELPGYEEVVELAMFDGKSTAGEVAIAINAAHKATLLQRQGDNSSDAPPPVDEPANNMKLESESGGPVTKEKLQKRWEKDTALQAEFAGDFETYLALELPGDGVKFKTTGKRGE